MIKGLSDRLKDLRIEHKYTQSIVEELTGLDRTTISAYELGVREPSVDSLIKLADIYHVSLDYLCGRENRRNIDTTNLDATLHNKLIAQIHDYMLKNKK